MFCTALAAWRIGVNLLHGDQLLFVGKACMVPETNPTLAQGEHVPTSPKKCFTVYDLLLARDGVLQEVCNSRCVTVEVRLQLRDVVLSCARAYRCRRLVMARPPTTWMRTAMFPTSCLQWPEALLFRRDFHSGPLNAH